MPKNLETRIETLERERGSVGDKPLVFVQLVGCAPGGGPLLRPLVGIKTRHANVRRESNESEDNLRRRATVVALAEVDGTRNCPRLIEDRSART